jgi:hypothetical protein
MATKYQRNITLKFASTFVMSLHIEQQHDSRQNIDKFAKNSGSIQDGGSNSNI